MKQKNLLLITLLFILFSQVTTLAQWRTIEAPYGIIQSFGAASEDKLFLPGGLGAGYVSTIAVYDINANTWSELPLSTPRTMIAAAINGDFLFCAGGIQFENGAVEYAEVEIYNIQTNEPVGLGMLSVPRIGHSVVSVGTKVIFAGGANPSIDGPNLTGFEAFSTVDIYDTATDTWSVAELSDARAGMAHAVLGNKAYFAGGDKGNGVVSDVVDIYDASTDTWTTDNLSIGRTFYGGGGTFKGKVYFAGGTTADSKTTTQIDIYDPASSTWSTEQLTTPRGGVQIGTTEDHILFAGGATESNLEQWQAEASSNIVDIYNAETGEWDIYEMAVQRMNHTVLSAQNQVFVIGGFDVSAGVIHSSIDVFRGKQLDYDGAVFDKSTPPKYSITTLNHLQEEFTVTYQLENTGKFSLNSISVIFEVKKEGEVIETETQVIDLPASGDIQEISYSYLPEEVGIYEITVSTEQPNIGSIFYTDSKTFEVSNNTLAKDDGGIENGWSFGFISPEHYGYFGTEYELLTTDQLTAVSTVVVPLPDFTEPTATFHLLIKAIDASGNLQEEDIYKSEPLTAGDYFKEDFSFATIELPNPITLESGRYLIAFGQDELGGMFSIGMDDSKGDAGYWEKNSFAGTDWENSPVSITLMIRPHFGESATAPAAEQWNKIANAILPIDQQILSIKLVDDNTIWMTSASSLFLPEVSTYIYRSTDGGATWESISIPDVPNHFAAEISPISDSVAYVAMIDENENALDGELRDGIFKTIDGGANWVKLENYPFNPVYFHFFNEKEGWVMGEEEDRLDLEDIIMSTTSDGGVTWSHIGGSEGAIPEGRSLPVVDSMEKIGLLSNSYSSPIDVVGNTILIGSNRRYWISKDKGANWEAFDSPLYTNDNRNSLLVAMKDEQTFMLASNEVGEEGIWQAPKAYATIDGGQTWIASDPPVHTSAIHYLPNTNNSFIISGHFQFNESSGLAGTARTDDLTTWNYVDSKPILTMDFYENQGIGSFGNIPSIGVTGDVFSWGEATTPAFDASIFRNSQYTYTQVTLNHLEEPVVLTYGIESIGLNDLTNVTFQLDVLRNGTSVFTDQASLETVDTNSIEEISFTYLPDEIGFYEFSVSVSQENIGQNFFQDVQVLNVNETTLQKDDGSPEVGIGIAFNSPEHFGYLGTEYKLLTDDQLQAITLLMVPDTTASFKLLIKAVDEDGNIQEEDIFKSDPIPGSEVPETFVYTYVFEEPLALEAGRYVFAAGEDERDGEFAYGYDSDRFDIGFWSYSPVDTTVWINEPVPLTMMLRPHFGDFMITSTEENLLAQSTPLKVFPVPFSESLFIQLEYPQESTARLQLFDVTGKQWSDNVVNQNQMIRQDFKGIPQGMYLLRISSGRYIRTIKVMKQ